ncbi:MAG: hypothetical protein JKY03_06045, partial [Aureispira sp.]|nr:hypothetical protein [Aureispira sp.]
KGKLEFFPELGLGLFSYRGIIYPVINLGTGLDYRSSNLLSFFIHTRYQTFIIHGGGLFSLTIGARFRFGGNKKKQQN